MPEPPELDFYVGGRGRPGRSARMIYERNIRQIRSVEHESPNQFLILIYNLFLADIHKAAAFLIGSVWLSKDGIFIDTPACFIQGFFISIGGMASCCFITFIAIHAYMSVVESYQPPQRVFYIVIACVWMVVYLLPSLSILGTMNGKDVGGLYTRAGAWCWISSGYQRLRLLTYYLFVLVATITIAVLYIPIYLSLRRQAHPKTVVLPLDMHHKRAFVLYPVVFVLCTLPMAVGRIVTMSSVDVPAGYYYFAGVLMSANGFFDCVVFGSTRHAIIFGSTEQVNANSMGLETFAFMRTPANLFGNGVWIQGGTSNVQISPNRGLGDWWPSQPSGRGDDSRPVGTRFTTGLRSISQEPRRAEQQQQPNDMAIRMEVVTSLTVEADPTRACDNR